MINATYNNEEERFKDAAFEMALDLDTYKSAVKSARGKRIKMSVGMAVGFIIVGIITLKILDDDFSAKAFFIFAVFWALYAMITSIFKERSRRIIERAFQNKVRVRLNEYVGKNEKNFNIQYTILINSNYIIINKGLKKLEYNIEDINKIYENSDNFALLIKDNEILVIPKEAFKSKEDEEKFKLYLKV